MVDRSRAVLDDTQEVELRLAKAMAHPVRVKALELLDQKPMAPVEVADRLDVPVSNMSYHFRTLLELEVIEEVSKEQVRGSLKTTYRSCVDLLVMQVHWGAIDGQAMGVMRRAILSATALRVTDAIKAKTIDRRPEFHITVQTVNATEEEWKEVTAMYEDARERLAEIAANSAEDSEPRFPATFSVQAYESPKLYEQ
jgi:DNA-binding transcriptional ArsR family regulator